MERARVLIEGKEVDRIYGATRKSLFNQAQYYYGHCLGRIMNSHDTKIGWRFARCGEKLGCEAEIYEIYFI